MENDNGTCCDHCNAPLNNNESYTHIDGMDLCDECHEDYRTNQFAKSISR